MPLYEIEVNSKWLEVTHNIFRSWTGERRIDGFEYDGPVYKLGAMSPEQDRAFAFLNNLYGEATYVEFADGMKITALDEDGAIRARWLVMDDGSLEGAYDPDNALEKYL